MVGFVMVALGGYRSCRTGMLYAVNGPLECCLRDGLSAYISAGQKPDSSISRNATEVARMTGEQKGNWRQRWLGTDMLEKKENGSFKEIGLGSEAEKLKSS